MSRILSIMGTRHSITSCPSPRCELPLCYFLPIITSSRLVYPHLMVSSACGLPDYTFSTNFCACYAADIAKYFCGLWTGCFRMRPPSPIRPASPLWFTQPTSQQQLPSLCPGPQCFIVSSSPQSQLCVNWTITVASWFMKSTLQSPRLEGTLSLLPQPIFWTWFLIWPAVFPVVLYMVLPVIVRICVIAHLSCISSI